MKSKIAILSLLLTGAAVSASAQTKEHYYSEKAKDNIFISVGVGAQGCVNPDNFDYGFGHAITPLIHASVGKLFDPIWGIRGQVAGCWSTLYSEYGMPEGEYKKMKNKNTSLYVPTDCSTCQTLSEAIIPIACSLYPYLQVRDLRLPRPMAIKIN